MDPGNKVTFVIGWVRLKQNSHEAGPEVCITVNLGGKTTATTKETTTRGKTGIKLVCIN